MSTRTRAARPTTRAGRKRASKKQSTWTDRVERHLPSPLRGMVERAREDDISLFAAGLGFYALVSAARRGLVVLWIVGLILAESRLRPLAEALARIAPTTLG